MDHELFPIGDNEAITAEIRLAARQFARKDQKELVCRVGPNETGHRLPQRIILDGGVIVEVKRKVVVPGKIWLGVKED